MASLPLATLSEMASLRASSENSASSKGGFLDGAASFRDKLKNTWARTMQALRNKAALQEDEQTVFLQVGRR
jgi:hypothetical protein